MMGATQVDRYGNQNIAALGDPAKPKVQLLGFRGAPGNTVCNPTSYFVPNHSPKVFVEEVDLVTGVGWDRGCLEIRRVVSEPRHVRLRHRRPPHAPALGPPGRHRRGGRRRPPGFELVVDDDLEETRLADRRGAGA